jgi:RNA polymerase primary sigma factor
MTSGSIPFEQTNGDDDATCAIDIYEDFTYNPERILFTQFSHDSTLRILNKLKDREKSILCYRYQLNGCKRHTLREIGEKLNISPETVRQIELRALKKISNDAIELRENAYVEAI